jgi:hypothetical protein
MVFGDIPQQGTRQTHLHDGTAKSALSTSTALASTTGSYTQLVGTFNSTSEFLPPPKLDAEVIERADLKENTESESLRSTETERASAPRVATSKLDDFVEPDGYPSLALDVSIHRLRKTNELQ